MKFIALLRGINISGRNKISMAELKSVLQENNYKKVETYINSGNVIFESDTKCKQNLMQDISRIIKNNFNLDIPVMVIDENELEDVLSHGPEWWGTANKSVYDNLIFIIPPATFDRIYNTIGQPNDYEKIKDYKNYIFWSYDAKNYSKSNWWVRTSSTKIKDMITIRTANTMKKVFEKCKTNP